MGDKRPSTAEAAGSETKKLGPPFLAMLDLPVAVLKVTLRALESIDLPPFPGSKIEGALGRALYALVCVRPDTPCSACSLQPNCPYGRLYEPGVPPGAPRRVRDAPRPFALGLALADETYLKPGQEWSFRIGLAGRAVAFGGFLVNALRALGEQGIGRGRGRFQVARVVSVDPWRSTMRVVLDGDGAVDPGAVLALHVRDLPPISDSSRVRLRLHSMTDIRHQGARVERLEFSALVKALQRRIGDLEQFHWEGRTLGSDFSAAVTLAERIRLVADGAYFAGQRRRATGGKRNWMDMEGLVGDVVFEGDLAPFAKLIRYGEVMNVGKMAAFGMGTYEVTE